MALLGRELDDDQRARSQAEPRRRSVIVERRARPVGSRVESLESRVLLSTSSVGSDDSPILVRVPVAPAMFSPVPGYPVITGTSYPTSMPDGSITGPLTPADLVRVAAQDASPSPILTIVKTVTHSGWSASGTRQMAPTARRPRR